MLRLFFNTNIFLILFISLQACNSSNQSTYSEVKEYCSIKNFIHPFDDANAKNLHENNQYKNKAPSTALEESYDECMQKRWPSKEL